MDFILSTIVGYLISLAANLRTAEILSRREEKLTEHLKQDDALHKALAVSRPLRDELRIVCADLARNRERLGVTPEEEPLWRQLSDDAFQGDIVEWLSAGGIEEGSAVKERLLRRMETTLINMKASSEQIAFIRSGYFDALEKAVFAHPTLAHWRHQLSLDYLREQVVLLRRRAEEAAGIYSPEKQACALNRYSEIALAAWDIIDLSNLPEGDIHIVTQKLLLRQLYMPLRIEVESKKLGDGGDAAIEELEEQREARRHREAGYPFFKGESDWHERADLRVSVGNRLGTHRRLVILGDPGAGKTTMLRWMATAYLLRNKCDPAFGQIPDTETLPLQPWIPVLIRCRDLGYTDLCRSFNDFLSQHLYKTELLPEEADVMRAVILDRIAKGEILLLVDGLDEITDLHVRMMFSQELERTAVRYPSAPIVITSRIVGYRDMPYRIRTGFEHGVIAELNREDKDLFARRWVEVTEQHQSATEKARRAKDLLDSLHSSDRIERLTGNPMLLTTLALVKRKVGKLPNRRHKLYAEAVSVLLNWNPRQYETIDEEEAIPQLEYLAYEMCRRGVQRLTDDEVLDLLEQVRIQYPNIRAIRRRRPQAFLALLEARSSILIKSGGVWQANVPREKAVWEFRHLTFQEYLAARSLLDGRYPGRDKTKSLADQVSPLAGEVQKSARRQPFPGRGEETEVPESWLEALRLLVADCKDDDVDNVLLSILNPTSREDTEKTCRPRAVLAALCLADEPNISEDTARQVLSKLVDVIDRRDGQGWFISPVDYAAMEVGGCIWADLFKRSLMNEFCKRPAKARSSCGGLWGMVEFENWSKQNLEVNAVFQNLVDRLNSGDRFEALSAAFTVMIAAFKGKAVNVEGLTKRMFEFLQLGWPEAISAVWALTWLNGGFIGYDDYRSSGTAIWVPTNEELEVLASILNNVPKDENDIKIFIINILGKVAGQISVNAILKNLEDSDAAIRKEVVDVLGRLGGPQIVPVLVAKLEDDNTAVRSAVAKALGRIGDQQVIPILVSKLDDAEIDVRKAVAVALGQLGAKIAVQSLVLKLDDADVGVRCAVASALGKLGEQQIVPAMVAKLDDEDAVVRTVVAKALGKLGDPQVVPILVSKLDDAETDVRKAVVGALGQLGDIEAVPSLIVKLDDPNIAVRWAVASALGKLGYQQAVPSLVAKLDDEDADVRTAVASALGKLGDQQTVPALLAKLDDEDADVRKAVAGALEQLGDQHVISFLVPLLEGPDHEVCVAVAAALMVLAGHSALKDFLLHNSQERRTAAVGEFVRIRGNPKEEKLLSRDFDGEVPWMDPSMPITETRIADAAQFFRISTQEARDLYESIAADYHLKFV